MIRALPHLLRNRPDIELRLIGTGSYEHRLRALVRRQGVDEHVRFLSVPTSDRDRMAALLQESSLVTLLSEYESQGLGAFEALSVHRPVLVLESTALAELARDGLAAAVPPRCTSAALAGIVDDVLRNAHPPVRSPTPPGWERTVNALADVHAWILASHAGRARASAAHARRGLPDRNGLSTV